MESRVADRPRPFCVEEETERQEEHGEVLVGVARFPQGVPEREAEVERPRRRGLFSHLPDDGEGNGGDPRRLDRLGRQTDGPVAGASGGDQQGVVDAGCGEPPGDFRGGPLPEGCQVGAVNVPHQPVYERVECTQGTSFH